jgi:cation diffusion facilitator CzcD-associated flavoprotein CzcO
MKLPRLWRIETRDGGEITARFVVSAVGAYIEKRPVTIPGFADFQGKVLEPTDWDYGYDLRGKRVAVIGTGATSVQIVPNIAPEVAHEGSIWASELTLLTAINRYTTYPWLQKTFEALVRWHMRRTLRDPELARKLTPGYPFGAKLGGMTNDYLQAYLRANVELVTDPIERFTPTGIRTRDGVERPIDAVVPAVGYRMAFDPAAYVDKPVQGRDGFELGHHFATQKLKAYQGITMPRLPN